MRIEHDMPMREYQDQPELSASQIKAINTNPHRWNHDRITGKGRRPTPAMILGSAVHSFIFEDGADVVLLDVDDYKTKVAREDRDAALAADKYPLKNSEWDHAKAMADSALRNPQVRELMKTGSPEVSFFTEDPSTGQPLRGRVDWMDFESLRIVDVKTTDSADPAVFAKQAGRMGWHVSAAHYGDSWGQHEGTGPWEVLFVLIERDAPHTVSVCRLGPGSLDLGRSAIQRGIRTYRQAAMTNKWENPWPGVTTVDLPAYEFYAEEAR